MLNIPPSGLLHHKRSGALWDLWFLTGLLGKGGISVSASSGAEEEVMMTAPSGRRMTIPESPRAGLRGGAASVPLCSSPSKLLG